MNDIDLITQVFTEKDQTMSKEAAMKKLVEILLDYPNNKAAGALGGAVSNGFLKREGDIYTRIK